MALERADRTEISKYVRDTVQRLPPRDIKAVGIGRVTGTPEADTPPATDSSDRIATTAFIQRAVAASVTSFNGRTGAVVSQSGDYTAAMVTNAADKASASTQVFAGAIQSSGRFISGAPATGGIWVDGATNTQFVGSFTSTQMGFYNTAWQFFVDRSGYSQFQNGISSVGGNSSYGQGATIGGGNTYSAANNWMTAYHGGAIYWDGSNWQNPTYGGNNGWAMWAPNGAVGGAIFFTDTTTGAVNRTYTATQMQARQTLGIDSGGTISMGVNALNAKIYYQEPGGIRVGGAGYGILYLGDSGAASAGYIRAQSPGLVLADGANGTVAAVNFFGGTPVGRQSPGGAVGSLTSLNAVNAFTGQQYGGTVGTSKYTVGDIVTALKNFGLLAA